MKKFNLGKGIEAVCDAKKTRNGFKHTATLFVNNQEMDSVKICYLNRTWERYEFQSVLKKLIDETKSLSEEQKKVARELVGHYKEDSGFGFVATMAKMGELFGANQQEKNNWKKRILTAGLEKQGLEFPDDWDGLPEDIKEARLNQVIEELIK
jgi:hypothetical protein